MKKTSGESSALQSRRMNRMKDGEAWVMIKTLFGIAKEIKQKKMNNVLLKNAFSALESGNELLNQ